MHLYTTNAGHLILRVWWTLKIDGSDAHAPASLTQWRCLHVTCLVKLLNSLTIYNTDLPYTQTRNCRRMHKPRPTISDADFSYRLHCFHRSVRLRSAFAQHALRSQRNKNSYSMHYQDLGGLTC